MKGNGNVRYLCQIVVFESSNVIFESKPHIPDTNIFEKKIVVQYPRLSGRIDVEKIQGFTGVTGFLDENTSAQFWLDDEIHKVYCLARGKHLHARMKESLIKRDRDGISSDARQESQDSQEISVILLSVSRIRTQHSKTSTPTYPNNPRSLNHKLHQRFLSFR
ncbi:hypothetical protein EAE99_004483 [Botrytis elliptica]|nr:hypothetical protein EAE99_004483 [Botrytis elliptica]